MRKRRKKIFYKNSLELWPFYPPRSNPDPMAKSHLNSMVDKLTFHIHTPFSRTNRAFPCVWITQECAHLPVNTAISGFADGTEPECSLVFRFYALIAGWECEYHKIGGNLILTGKIKHLRALRPNNCTSGSSLQASISPCLHMDHLRIWWKCRSGAAPEILCFESRSQVMLMLQDPRTTLWAVRPWRWWFEPCLYIRITGELLIVLIPRLPSNRVELESPGMRPGSMLPSPGDSSVEPGLWTSADAFTCTRGGGHSDVHWSVNWVYACEGAQELLTWLNTPKWINLDTSWKYNGGCQKRIRYHSC